LYATAQKTSEKSVTLETSHVLMWPYVAVAAAASVHHASRAASSSARLPKTLGGGEGGGDGGDGGVLGTGGELGAVTSTHTLISATFSQRTPSPACRRVTYSAYRPPHGTMKGPGPVATACDWPEQRCAPADVPPGMLLSHT